MASLLQRTTRTSSYSEPETPPPTHRGIPQISAFNISINPTAQADNEKKAFPRVNCAINHSASRLPSS